MATNILTIGDHSFISLYNWALSNNTDNNVHTIFHYSKSHAKINNNNAKNDNDDDLILVKLNDLLIKSNEKNKINKIDSLKYLKSSTINLDLIIIYCKSLEDYSETLAKLVDLDLLLPTKTKIIIENTGSIPLNNFVNLSLPENLQGNIDIYYSLNKVNFRPILDEQKNKISYELKTSNDNQIQLAHLINSNNNSNKNSSCNKEMMKFMSKIFKPYQIDFVYVEDSSKAFNEFWKHSVYSIVIQPLMIIFELDSFKKLEKFILCKPLLKGLYNELIKIYSLQTNLEDADLKNLKTYFKWLFAKEDSLISLDLIEFNYNFENSFDLNILYPILLADDLKIKIPYLEFLYSILQQFNNYRFNKSNNFISKHKYTSQLEQLTIKLGKLEEQLNSKVNVLAEKLQVSETDNGALNQRNENLNNENDSLKHQLEIQVSDLQKRLQEEEMLKNDFLEQLTKLKINQTNRKSYTAVVGAVASGAAGNSATNTYMSSGDDEDYVDARESIARKSQLIQTTNLENNNDDFNEPTTPVVENAKNSRSIQGVNAQFSSPRSNTEAGLKALKDIQLFSEYAIYYGSPDKPATTTPTNGTNSTDTAVNEKDTSMEPQYDSKDVEEEGGEDYDDNTIENDNDISMESLKQKQLELQKRELLLEQRERMFMGGNGSSMIHPPPPPKQQFPPIPRKASVGTFNKQIQLPTAMRMSYMQQQQGPVYDVNGNIIMQNSAPITPTGNAPFNPNYQQKPYIQKQQQQQQQMYFPPPGSNQQYNIVPPQMQGRSVSQPITGSGHRILSNGSGNQLSMQPQQQQQQQQQQQPVPQAHHPQYIKTSRKNRSSVMIPSASKMNQNSNYDILNVNTQNSSEVLPVQTTPAFDDFGTYNNNPNMHRNSSVGQEGYMPMMMNNGSQRALKTKPSFHNISKKPSFQNINSGSNILPPGFTNTADLGNGNGSSTSLATHSISPQTAVGGGANMKTANGSSTALTGNIIEEDENAKSVLEALSIKHEKEHEHEEEEKEYFTNDVNSDEFKLNTIKSEVKDKLDELASVADVKHEDINNKKHKKLSKLFGRRKASD